jgi:MFS transporter, ACS family, glucarate transporter
MRINPNPEAIRKPAGGVRWVIISCAFLVAAVSYLDRTNISIASSFLQKEFGLADTQLGFVFGAFIAGYALAQPVAGLLADRFGATYTIAGAILWWSLFTALVPMIPAGISGAFAILLAVRFLLGIGEAIVFPATNRLVADWIPSRERGLASGLVFTGVGVGGGIAPPLITFIMLRHNWRWAFWVSALIGVGASVIWLVLVRNRPENHKCVNSDEAAYIAAGMPPHSRRPNTSPRSWEVIWDRQVAILTLGYFCYGYTAYIFFTWFFRYLSDVRGLNLATSAGYATLPFVAMAVASPFGGLVSDRLVVRLGKRVGRCGVAGLSPLLASIFVWAAAHVGGARLAAVVLAGGAAALYFSQSAFWAISADIGSDSVGTVSGVMNMGGQLGGMVTAYLTPVIANSRGWTASFETAALICLCGALAWLFVDPNRAPRT